MGKRYERDVSLYYDPVLNFFLYFLGTNTQKRGAFHFFSFRFSPPIHCTAFLYYYYYYYH